MKIGLAQIALQATIGSHKVTWALYKIARDSLLGSTTWALLCLCTITFLESKK